MAHAVSLTYARFDHMSPTALAMTTALHVAVAAALYLVSPLNHIDTLPDSVEITVERALPAETPQPTPIPESTPTPPLAAAMPSPPPPAPPVRMGLPPVGPSTDPKATPGTPQPAQAKPETPAEAAQPEPAQPEPAKPEQQQALATPSPPPAPPLPPAPKLENALPPLEAPPPPLTSQEVPRPAPPPPAPKPPLPQPQRAQPAPPPQRPPQQQQALQAPPPADQQASRPAFVNPSAMYGQRRVEDQYLWYVAQKLSQQQFVRNVTTEGGSLVLRITIARDGRLVDVGLVRSSGLPALDNVVLNTARQAAPYMPLPDEILGAQRTFTLPLNFKRNG